MRMQEIVVTGVRGTVNERHLPATVSVIGREALTRHERNSILPTLMEQVPSLLVTSRGVMGYGVSTGASGNMTLRGLSSGAGQLMVLIDGHPQYNGVYGHSIADSYQTLLAERVEVLRGPASVLYGSNAMGGVINIVTRQMPGSPWSLGTIDRTLHSRTRIDFGMGSYATMQGGISNQLRKGIYSSTVALQYNRSDNHRKHMQFEQYGGYLKQAVDLSKNWQVYADLNLTHFKASNPGTASDPKIENDQYITRGAASLVLKNRYANTHGAVHVYDNFGIHKINDGYALKGGKPQSDLFRSKDAVAGVSVYQTYQLPIANEAYRAALTAGVDYQHIYGRAYYTDRTTGARVTTPRRLMQSAHAHENEVAGYLNYVQELGGLFTLEGGLRYDHHSTAGDEWVPQVGLVYRPLHSGELKLSASKGFRNPTTREMYMYGTANHDSLRAERMWNYELAWKQRLCGGRFSYGANLFYIKGDNMIQTVAGRNINSGEFENTGVELDAQWRVNQHWTLQSNHSYLHMETPIVASPTYKGYVGATARYGRWMASVGVQQLCGLYTAVDNAKTPADEEQKEDVTLLNATLSYQPSSLVRLYVKGDNLLAQRYEINAGYPMPRATVMGGIVLDF